MKPSPNLEFGFAATRLFAGTGVPFTTHKLLQAIFSTGNGAPGSSSDPGDARGAFDFTYRVPGLRDWLTFYGDGFTDDEPSPLWGAFDKSAFNAGLYFPHLPKVPKLDFRVEGVYTDNPNPNPVLQRGFFYFNARYRNGYTNDGNLIGSWIGRQGQGAQAWSTYWFSAERQIAVQFSSPESEPAICAFWRDPDRWRYPSGFLAAFPLQRVGVSPIRAMEFPCNCADGTVRCQDVNPIYVLAPVLACSK